MQDFLETERMVLRRFTVDDVDHLIDLDSDPEVMRFLTGGIPTPREAIQNDILPAFLRSYEPFSGFGVFAAIGKEHGEFLGWFSFRPKDVAWRDEVSLGYRLRRSIWGQGYATEGARALILLGFTELGVQRVVASTYQDNLSSRRVMEKAGLSLVRTYRMTTAELQANDSTVYDASETLWDGDDVEYALRKADWEQQEGASQTYLSAFKKSASLGNLEHKSAQGETTWDGDDHGETIFEQRVERDYAQAIRETYHDDWVKKVGAE